LSYQNPDKDLAVELYLGKPGRIDDVRSIEGDYLLGVELFSHHKTDWQSEILPVMIDILDVRLGLQRLKNEATSQRLNIGLNSEGRLANCEPECLGFKSQLLLTYQFENQQLEDLLVDIRLPINKALRLRFSYEYYRPELIENPGFREQFFGYYALGKQNLLRSNVDYQVSPRVSVFIEGIHSTREIGDSGLGLHGGLKIRQVLGARYDMDLSLAADSVELGEDSLTSIYITIERHINSRLNIQLDGIIRREEKHQLGKNRVFGLNAKLNYMAKNNLIFSLEGKAINNSRLRNEHLLRLGMRYYFDNFKAKRSTVSQKTFTRVNHHVES